MMSTLSPDSESLMRLHVCGLWASLRSAAVWWLVDRTTWSHRTVVGTAADGQGQFGGLLTERLGLSDCCRRRWGKLVGGRPVGC